MQAEEQAPLSTENFDETLNKIAAHWEKRPDAENFQKGLYPISTPDRFIQLRTEFIGLIYKTLDIKPEDPVFLETNTLIPAYLEWMTEKTQEIGSRKAFTLWRRICATDRFFREWVDPTHIPYKL